MDRLRRSRGQRVLHLTFTRRRRRGGASRCWPAKPAALSHGRTSATPSSTSVSATGGLEVDREPFEIFARARAAGLRSLPHVGEAEGPDRVWSPFTRWAQTESATASAACATRALVEHLREQQIPLDVSLTSNLCARSVASLQEHLLPLMLEQGLLVTLNSDDPPMFDGADTGFATG